MPDFLLLKMFFIRDENLLLSYLSLKDVINQLIGILLPRRHKLLSMSMRVEGFLMWVNVTVHIISFE